MKKSGTMLVLTMAIFSGGSCKMGDSIPTSHSPRSALDALKVNDAIPVASGHLGLKDLVFTFPVFESGAAATKASIASGDFHVVSGPTLWKLEGDGAQPPVGIELLTSPGMEPCQVRLSYGPVFDGVGLQSPTYIYVFERADGGWRRLSRKVID